MGGLTSVSLVALLGSAGTSGLMLALICESNFLRRQGRDQGRPKFR